MSNPEADEVLFAYLVIASHVISLVLIQVDSGIQRPVYYVSKLLHEAEVRYLPLEKAILAVVHATHKISPLLPGTHCSCPKSVSTQVNTLKRRLYQEDC